MAVGKGSAASIYATVGVEEGEGLPKEDDTAGASLTRFEGAFSEKPTASDASSSVSSNVSTPTTTSAQASSALQLESTSYLDGQPKTPARPLLDRLDLRANNMDPSAPSPGGSPPMTPARRRLIDLDLDAASRSPGSRSVHIALTSPSTARTPLAATAPLPETPLKHGQDAGAIATPTRASIVERRQAPAMPPLPSLPHGDNQDRPPRGLGLGLTPSKQSSNAFFGGPVSPNVTRGDARGPNTPSSRTRLLDFDVTSTTDEDSSLSLTAQDIESSMLIPASSDILPSMLGDSLDARSAQSPKDNTASDDLDSMLARVKPAKESCAKTVRGSGASRWADPESNLCLPKNGEGNPEATASLLSRMSVAPDSSPETGKYAEPTRRTPSKATKARGSQKGADNATVALARGHDGPLTASSGAFLAAPSDLPEPLSPSSSAAKTPVIESSGTFGGQSAKGLISQVRSGSSLTEPEAVDAKIPVCQLPFTSERDISPSTVTQGGSPKASSATAIIAAESPSVASPLPHFDWADDDEDEDELPDLDGWGVTLPQTPSNASRHPEPVSPSPQGQSSKDAPMSVSALPATLASLPTKQQGLRSKKSAGRRQKGEHRTDGLASNSSPPSRLGGIRIAGVASSLGSVPSPSGSSGVAASPRRELLPSSSSSGTCHTTGSVSARGLREKGSSEPEGGAWLHDMVQGPPPPKRTDRPKPQLSDNGAFARMARGIVGIKGTAAMSGGEKAEVTAATMPAATDLKHLRHALSAGPAESGTGTAVKGKGGSKGRGQASPRKTGQAKSPAKT